jgi:hypothetical protein
MSNVATKKYQIIYSSDKSIKFVFFGDSYCVTPFIVFETDNYNELVNYIYDENLYEDKNSYIDYETLKQVEEDVKETLIKYDD